MTEKLSNHFFDDAQTIQKLAMQTLFERLNSLCEGAIAVDKEARVVWINEKYARMLGFHDIAEVLGQSIEQVIPNSLMREVAMSGQPILLDLMEFGRETFVVTRMPLQNDAGQIIGAIGFVLYDRLNYLKPFFAKFARLQTEVIQAGQKNAERRGTKYTLASFVGTGASSVEVKRQARLAAQHESSVLLLGETGTGKELLAHAIHVESPRASQAFVAVNMAAFPEALLEAEFFGTAAGAYTGADKKGRDGKFKLADGGTLFLDEIGDMPLSLQAKLLRALQDQEIEPLGSNRIIKVDVRIIAATSVDLKRMVHEGKFRSDLYYRLSVLPITLPPLRQRLEDMELLCHTILAQIAQRSGLPRPEITPTAIATLQNYEWPGNIRELRNVLEQAAMLTDKKRLNVDDIAALLPVPRRTQLGALSHGVRPYADAIADFERELIANALQAAGGKVSEAARLLGISRAALYKKIAALGNISIKRD
jgi:transcriptional regulator with PAS, ATPase and Fis domain